MKATALALPAVALMVLIVGCGSEPAGTEVHAESFLRALAVAPEATIVHRGEALYYGGTKSDTHRQIVVRSHDPELDSRVYIQMLSSSPQRIDTIGGVFPLEPRNFLGGDNEGRTALYLLDGDRFVAETGKLTITEATGGMVEGRMEGTFEFTAVYWCNPSTDRDACFSLPSEFPTSVRRIRVEGEFVAIPSGPADRLCEACL